MRVVCARALETKRDLDAFGTVRRARRSANGVYTPSSPIAPVLGASGRSRALKMGPCTHSVYASVRTVLGGTLDLED
jgi:hypothetical protein